MLSFCAKKSDKSVGTEGLDELSWYEDIFPLEKEFKIFLEFSLVPLKQYYGLYKAEKGKFLKL